MLGNVASEYVTGRVRSVGARVVGGELDGATEEAAEYAHAVRRSDADAAPPWTAVCGTPVGHVQGSWTPGEGRAATPCPRCRELTGT